MFFDLPQAELEVYCPPRQEPEDFDSFWAETLATARSYPLSPIFTLVDFGLKTVETYDVTFNGYGGQKVKGWLLVPQQRPHRLPCVVEYIGYGGGRGFPIDRLLWSSAGYVHLVMDIRGQGSEWMRGDTPDTEPDGSNPQTPGFLTRGVLDPRKYYYRRVYVDAVRAVETAFSCEFVDPDRVLITGVSQGGGISLAVAGFVPDLLGVMPDVPFLCDIRTATGLVDTEPYNELARYCKVHRDQVETVFTTLSYFDGMNFAVRSKAPALFSTGLMDDTCPPRTVYAAFNHYSGPKQIIAYPYNQHEGGESFHKLEQLHFAAALART